MSLQNWCHGSRSSLGQSLRASHSAWCRGRCWLASGLDEEPWPCHHCVCGTPSGLMWAVPWLAGWTAPPNNVCHDKTHTLLILQSGSTDIREEGYTTQTKFQHWGSQSPFLDASGDEAGQVPTLAVLHYNVQSGVSPIYDAVIVPNYVWVLELPEEVHLWHQHLFFTLCHGAIV